jgi:hypothetical protein
MGTPEEKKANRNSRRRSEDNYLPPTPIGETAPIGPEAPHYPGFTITLRHTTASSTPLDEQLAQRRDHYLTTHNTHIR